MTSARQLKRRYYGRRTKNDRFRDSVAWSNFLKEIENLCQKKFGANWLSESTVYSSSDALLDLIYRGVERNELTGSAYSQETKKQILSENVSERIHGFIATMCRGLAMSNDNTFTLSKDRRLIEIVVRGFLHRIPVVNNVEAFKEELYFDLIRGATSQLFNFEHAKLTVIDGELVLELTKPIPKQVDTGWVKAKVFIPS